MLYTRDGPAIRWQSLEGMRLVRPPNSDSSPRQLYIIISAHSHNRGNRQYQGAQSTQVNSKTQCGIEPVIPYFSPRIQHHPPNSVGPIDPWLGRAFGACGEATAWRWGTDTSGCFGGGGTSAGGRCRWPSSRSSPTARRKDDKTSWRRDLNIRPLDAHNL